MKDNQEINYYLSKAGSILVEHNIQIATVSPQIDRVLIFYQLDI
jgi:hypothetical protein